MQAYTLRTTTEQQMFEEALLAPYACLSSRTAGRLHDEPPSERGDSRTAFQHDRDRIQHSIAFRQLSHKTQVYPFHEGDYYRTRLTHTIEVTEIGRALARLLRANEDLVEAISLAHDVGHPPFGHAGERALCRLMSECGDEFDHNVQSLRVLDQLETRYPGFPGLNLTQETREGIARHSTPYDTPGSSAEFSETCSSLEAQISSIADQIAYCTHDIEDAVLSRLVGLELLERSVPLWQEGWAQCQGVGPYLEGQPERVELVRLRSTVRLLISWLLNDAANATLERINAVRPTSPADVRALEQPLVSFSATMNSRLEPLQNFLYDRVYYNPKVLRMTRKGEMIIERLWYELIRECDPRSGPRLLPWAFQERLRVEEIPLHRVVCDFLAGMTDRSAMQMYNVLYEPYESSLQTVD